MSLLLLVCIKTFRLVFYHIPLNVLAGLQRWFAILWSGFHFISVSLQKEMQETILRGFLYKTANKPRAG